MEQIEHTSKVTISLILAICCEGQFNFTSSIKGKVGGK